jgi:hypothetical protein
MSHGRAARIVQEDREARERIKAEATRERYMAKLRRLNPGRVAAEAQLYVEYVAASPLQRHRQRRAASSSSAPAQGDIDLCND